MRLRRLSAILAAFLLTLFAGCGLRESINRPGSDAPGVRSDTASETSGDAFPQSSESVESAGPAETVGTAASNESNGDLVILQVVGGWNYESDKASDGLEFVLPDGQALYVMQLFYEHDREILDSPLDSIGTIVFHVGSDYLDTSPDNPETLTGRIGGSLVKVELSEAETEKLSQIILQYAPSAMEAPEKAG